MRDDSKILKDCLKGKELAFKEMYDKYKRYCYTICVRYGVPELEIKDCMQNIFTEIFKSIDKYDKNKAQFKTWMTRITINQILLWKRKKRVEIEDAYESNVNMISEAQEFNKYDEEFILKILSQMPSQFLQVFNLIIIDGYSHKEVSEKLNITESKSRVFLHRGRAWAMEKLGRHFEVQNEPEKKKFHKIA